VKGTDLATTRLFLGTAEWTETLEFYRDQTPRGIMATAGGAGIILHRESMIKIGSDLGCQYVLLPLLSGMLGNVTPAGAMADKTWTFDRSSYAVSNPTLDAFTFEFVHSDGTTNHVALAMHYAMCTRLKVSIAKGGPAKWDSDWFGRATKVETLTAAITAQANHDVSLLPSEVWKVSIDTSYANALTMNTQIVGVIVSAEMEWNFGTKGITTLDGRADLDFIEHKTETMSGTVKLVMELDAVSAAYIVNWRANTLQYISIKGVGVALGGTFYSAQFTAACRYVGNFGFSEDGENVLVALDLEMFYDTTAAKMTSAIIVNDLAAMANI